MKNHYPSHQDDLAQLARIEGQVRGVRKMVEEGRYCVDILRTLNAAVGGIKRVEDKILKRHLDCCVTGALKTSSRKERDQKIDEILGLISDFRKY